MSTTPVSKRPLVFFMDRMHDVNYARLFLQAGIPLSHHILHTGMRVPALPPLTSRLHMRAHQRTHRRARILLSHKALHLGGSLGAELAKGTPPPVAHMFCHESMAP